MESYNKRLKNILVKNNILTLEVGNKLMHELVEEEGASLWDKVQAAAYIDERSMLSLVAREVKLPPIDLAKVCPTQEALDCLPQDSARSYGVLPVSKIGGVLTLATSNPFDLLRLDDLRILTGCDIMRVVCSVRDILDAISRAYNPGEQKMEQLFEDMEEPNLEFSKAELEEDIDVSDLTDDEGGSPIVKLVNLLVAQAIRDGVSDIHIEPFEQRVRIRYRRDGVLYETISPPKKLQSAIVSRIKIMADLDIAEKRKPQDGKFRIRADGRPIDFRVSILPVIFGEKVVIRILDSSSLLGKLDDAGFGEKVTQDLKWAVTRPYGMMLVTGPTGSGKSTTLYSCIREIMNVEDNIVTVEDPVEYQLDGVNQVQVNPKRGITFSSALRSILRQDPDIVLLGEIRDTETAQIAIKAALTGHLVLSTLHTNDAASSITRLIDMGVDPFMVASSTCMVVAQRLARRLCLNCREAYETPIEPLLELGFNEAECQNLTLYRPVGCASCANGYRGRFGLLETMRVSAEIKRMIISGKSAVEIKEQALAEGMSTLRQAGLDAVASGLTSVEEVLRVTMVDF